MRDPDLMQRAEQAATALEEAWMRWRVRYGLSTGQRPPVSSYVGYSVDEPWGQPRVVFGMEATEAEHLAAILDGRDYVAAPRAEGNGRPERQQPEIAPPRAESNGRPERQQQASVPAAWTTPAGSPDVPAQPTGNRDIPAHLPSATPPWPVVPHRPDWRARSVQPEPQQHAAAPPGRGPVVPVPAPAPASVPAPAPAPAQDEVDYDRAEELTAEQPILPRALRRAAALADAPAELPDHEAAYLQELAARPGIVALRPRGARPESLPEPGAAPWRTAPYLGQSMPYRAQPPTYLSQSASAPGQSGSAPGQSASSPGPSAASPAQSAAGPAQSAAGPVQSATGVSQAAASPRRQQEVPPGVIGEAAPVAGKPEHAGESLPSADGPAGDEVQVNRLLPVSRLIRPRKPSKPSEPGQWPAAGDSAHTPTDTAV